MEGIQVERRRMADQVREILLGRILDGTYGPGHRLVELEVAREMGTSQAPVREALRELKALRLVTTKPHCGTHVREVTEREMLEALEVRSLLEEFAALRGGERVKDRMGALREAVRGMRAAAGKGDLAAFGRHDLAFHRTIMEAAEHEGVLRTWASLGVDLRIRFLLRRPGLDLAAVAAAHEPIADAFEAGDAVAAGRLLREHPGAVHGMAEG